MEENRDIEHKTEDAEDNVTQRETKVEHTDVTPAEAPRQEYDRPAFRRFDRRRYGRRRGLRALAVLVVLLLLVFGAGYAGAKLGNNGSSSSAANYTTSKNDGNTVVTQTEQQISDIVDKVGPSVVSIVSEGTSTSSSGNSAYDYFFGGGSSGQSQTTESAGTGIIVSSDGYIMTNEHVIDGASTVSVQLSNGTTYDNVTVIGRDPLNDVAFLKIKNVTGLTAATIGNSSTLRQGQQVVAIGNALGQYQNSVTSGIVSGVGRPVTASSEDSSSTETLDDLIQTDAAINSGNSGGPLVNLSGQVIGMNTAVASDAQSIGFAIPINATKGVLNGVLANGKIARAYLGVAYTNITPAVKKQYNLSADKGAYVYSSNGSAVVSGSPADKAGVKDGDIITMVNDDTVGEAAGLSTLLAQYTPGTSVQLTILRDGKTQTVTATLTQYNG